MALSTIPDSRDKHIKMMVKKALFLDRDGVINQMVAYPGDEPYDSPKRTQDVTLVPGIIDIIRWANDRRIPVIEITNQPGVAKGKMNQSDAVAIETQVHQLLSKHHVHTTKPYICPHHPHGVIPELTQDCQCRKPKPGLLLQAATEMKVNLSTSIFLGDSSSDVQAGVSAGCHTIIFIHQNNIPQKLETAKNAPADYKIDSLLDVIPILDKYFSPATTSP